MSLAEGSVEYSLPITTEGVVRLTPRLRERYLTEQADRWPAIVHASGQHLRIWIWSDRENICVSLPFDGFRVERAYTRSLHRWGVNVNRWTSPGKQNDQGVGWWNNASIETHYGGSSNKPMVEATVHTFEGVRPDV